MVNGLVDYFISNVMVIVVVGGIVVVVRFIGFVVVEVVVDLISEFVVGVIVGSAFSGLTGWAGGLLAIASAARSAPTLTRGRARPGAFWLICACRRF